MDINLTVLDLDLLAMVTGGADEDGIGTTTTTSSDSFKIDVPALGSAEGSDTRSTTTSESNAYMRCLKLIGDQSGSFEAGNTVACRQKDLCTPLLSPQQQQGVRPCPPPLRLQ